MPVDSYQFLVRIIQRKVPFFSKISSCVSLAIVKMEEHTTIDFFSEILPPEVTHAVLSFLSPIDVVNASQVSKTFAGLLDSRGIWKRIVEEKFGPLNEEIFKGNIINWRNIYSRGSELLKFKKCFAASQALTLSYYEPYHPLHGCLPKEKYSMVNRKPDALIFYRDKAKRKPFASLYFYCPPVWCKPHLTRVVGFSQNYVLILMGTKLQLWNFTIDCKHTDEHKWKSAANKEELCKKKCSFVRDISMESKASEFYWCEVTRCVLFTTFESIRIIDLNSGEESTVEVPFEKYGTKNKIMGRNAIAVTRIEQIAEVRVMHVNGVPMTFCHVSSVNGEFFVNLTTKRVHLFVDQACALSWISKSLKVAVMNAKGDRMRVVSIAEEQPKILAKLNFDKKMNGVVSSPEGHVLFIWFSTQDLFGPNTMRMRPYLWEIGYTIGEISRRSTYGQHSTPPRSFFDTDATGKHYLVVKRFGHVVFNTQMKF